ncbi:MAG: hypothetical protein ACREE9_02955 [Stellaceae bacterium]
MFFKQIASVTAFGAALLLGAGLSAPRAQAAYTVTLEPVGSNVVATGSGAIDLTGLSSRISGSARGGVVPSSGEIITGPASFTAVDGYTGFTGPANFGSGGGTLASGGTGDLVGIGAFGTDLVVPAGYTSGSSLSDTATYDNATFASLGVTPGTYLWTWGTPALDDTFTLNIGAAAVPEPSSLLLLALPLGLVLLLAARQAARDV